jgi:anti-anti-sigma factor
MLEINISAKDNVTIINLKGRFDGLGATLFDEEIQKIEKSMNFWVLDFTSVDYLSSAGIRSLIKAEKFLRSLEGKLNLVGLTSNVKKVLELTGLTKQFKIHDTANKALEHITHEMESFKMITDFNIENRNYRIRKIAEGKCRINLWGTLIESNQPEFSEENLVQANLEELDYAFGIGGFGNSSKQAAEGLGEFVSGCSFAGVVPADGYCHSDFIVIDNPEDGDIYISSALSLSGEPSYLIEEKTSSNISIKTIIRDIHNFLSTKDEITNKFFGLMILAEVDDMNCKYYKTKKDISENLHLEKKDFDSSGVLLIGAAADRKSLNSKEIKTHTNLIKHLENYQINNNYFFHGHCLLLSELFSTTTYSDPKECFEKIIKLENMVQTAHLDPESKLRNARIWVYLPDFIQSADEKRLKIETTGKTKLEKEWEPIIRRIYSETNRVVISELTGGFTSKAFHVTSYDKNNRRLLPTVLKIGSIENTKNEVNAYHDYVKKFILNNSTSIMGTMIHGDWGGLRYNFVGINGPDSKLSWLSDYYRKLPVEELIPIFDRIFKDILKPWYGQPKWETIYPYKEHNPLRMFPDIFDTLHKELGISADEETINCIELNKKLPNPYYFLKYEYPKRENHSKLWYKGITHGDLNMQNILLDEVKNIYIIDFSETKPRNITSDFARLEPVFKFEMIKLENEQDLKELLEFELGLSSANSLDEKPAFTYNGTDPMVEKAYRMICHVREYASKVTVFETDIIPYLIAILEWTLPIVCYWSVELLQKKLAVYSAALICQKIMELES